MAAKIIRSRQVVTLQGIRDGGVLVEDGVIRAVLDPGDFPIDMPVEDLGHLALLPGAVDPHVHCNEPGNTNWEGFATATRAAAAGGITTLVDMPLNSIPVTTSIMALEAKRLSTRGKLSVNVGFHGGLVPGNSNRVLDLVQNGVLGVKAFLCHSGLEEFPATGEEDLREAMQVLAMLDVPLLAHAEIVDGDAPTVVNARSHHGWMRSRPPRFETAAIEMLLRLCEETRCRLHIVHLATGEALDMLADARRAGLPVTVETCPHYLTFAAEEIPEGATLFKCAPPIRNADNREALWEGLREGIIDLVASDHSPCPPELKHLDDGDFVQAWGGIASLQSSLSATWTGAKARGFSLADLARWTSTAPAKLVGLSDTRGAIEPGRLADLVAFDPEAKESVVGAKLLYRHRISPYVGRELTGVVRKVWLAGEPIVGPEAGFEPLGSLL